MRKKIILIITLSLILFVLVISLRFFQNNLIINRNLTTSDLYLQQIKDVPLSGGANRLDYQSVEYNTQRLYISHLGSHMIHVYDLRKQKIVKDIPLSGSPYGILAIPSLKKVYVSANNQVAVIDETSLKVIKYIHIGETPDGLAYNAQTNQIFVSNENGGTVSVINAQTNENITDIPIGGGVGNSHNFARQNRIYTAVGNDNILAEINPTTDKVLKKYPLQGCSHPHGFYIDPQTGYAFITCDGNNVMLVFDLNNKKILTHDTVGAGPDVLAYDEGLHRLYVAAESGVMTIFEVNKGTIKKLYQGFIAPHAHTVAVDQTTHIVYLPLENINGRPVLRILKPL